MKRVDSVEKSKFWTFGGKLEDGRLAQAASGGVTSQKNWDNIDQY